MAINLVPFDMTKTAAETNKVRPGRRMPSSVDETQAIKPIDKDTKQPKDHRRQTHLGKQADEDTSAHSELGDSMSETGTEMAQVSADSVSGVKARFAQPDTDRTDNDQNKEKQIDAEPLENEQYHVYVRRLGDEDILSEDSSPNHQIDIKV